MEVGNYYSYSDINDYARTNSYLVNDYGLANIGEHFLCLKKNINGYKSIISYVLDSHDSYMCVYSD